MVLSVILFFCLMSVFSEMVVVLLCGMIVESGWDMSLVRGSVVMIVSGVVS